MNTIKYKYTGSGAIPGIPARDLSEDEVKVYEALVGSAGSKKVLLASGLWEKLDEVTKDTIEKKQENS